MNVPATLSLRFRPVCRIVATALLTVTAAGLGAPRIHAQTLAPRSSRFVVVLDPAHGGQDPGARLSDAAVQSEAEKDFTLALSVRLRSLLQARGIQVITTRESDTTMSSDQRAEIANRAAPQACLVLHAAMSGAGVHLFLSSLPPAPATRFTPWRTAQAAAVSRSLALAGVLNSALRHAGTTVTLGRTALTTIDSMACPAVAIEIAPQEASPGGAAKPGGWSDPAYQARLAEALAAGLLEWREEGRQP